jgi:hypothetical protein
VVFFGAKFEDRTLGSRDQPPHFFNRRRVNPVFRVAKFHTIPAHGFGIVARAFSHASPRHSRSDRHGIAVRSKIPGKRILLDDVLSRIRLANRKL